MAESVEIVVLDDFLPAIAAALDPVVKKLLTQAAQATVDIAKANAPVASGFLQSSIYYKTKDASTYGQGIVPGVGDSYMLPEAEAPSGDEVVVISAAADYALFQEYGTIYQPGTPFLTPAAAALTAMLNAGDGMDMEAAIAALIGL
jgi:HK97 gp10 family phage protein